MMKNVNPIKKQKDYISDILYQNAIEEEKEWRKEKINIHDVEIVDKLLYEVRALGYSYNYLADITHRDNSDEKILNILLQYIGCFKDEEISAFLISAIGRPGNLNATETILKNYANSSEESQRTLAGFYDNALYRIKDKRYICDYLNLLKNPETAIRFPLTMIMLAKWHNEEAKLLFLKYLNCPEDQINLLFIALEALSYYTDKDGLIIKEINKKSQGPNKNLAMVAKKVAKKLKKR